MRDLINIASEGISEDWFKTDSFETYKKGMPEHYEIADEDGDIDTLESNGTPQHYEKGWYILTGPKGEQYSMPPEEFHKLKDDNGDGTCIPKKIVKLAKLADHNGVVNTSWGEPLHYTKGKDVIVRHGQGDYGVVKKDIFEKTYV
jgi:hypothetical protein